MHIAMGLLGIVLAGCFTALMLAAFLFIGGPLPMRK